MVVPSRFNNMINFPCPSASNAALGESTLYPLIPLCLIADGFLPDWTIYTKDVSDGTEQSCLHGVLTAQMEQASRISARIVGIKLSSYLE